MCSSQAANLQEIQRPDTRDLRQDSICPGCGGVETHRFFALDDVPINCSALWPTSESARGCTTGRIDLTRCADCELIFNSTFDRSAIKYNELYENSLASSPAFLAYRAELIRHLYSTHGLNGKKIAEIGCGGGQFLREICEVGRNFGIGYDPSVPEDVVSDERVRFVRDYYSEVHALEGVDLICCRHVLEHMADPFEFLCRLKSSLAQQGDVALYFEVPNARFVFSSVGLWDIIYPHVSYFGLRSLQSMVLRAGFQIIRSGSSFENQFLSIEARVSAKDPAGAPAWSFKPASAPGATIDSFPGRYRKIVRTWSSYIRNLQKSKRVAFWGAGTKGVTFLNLISGAREIGCVVDANSRKQGMYVPGTGQLICAPAELRRYRPDVVVVLNPAYVGEISAMLSDMGVNAESISDQPTGPQ